MSPSAQRRWQKAQQYLASRQTTAARIALEAFLQHVPTHTDARVLLAGAILSEEGQIREAWAQLREAGKSLPEDADKIAMVALAMFRVGDVTGARACLEHSAVARASAVDDLMSLAHVSQLLGQHEYALGFMDRARATGIDNADFRYFRGVQLQFNGRLDEAATEMDACLKMDADYGRASLALARLRKQTHENNHLAFIGERLRGNFHDSEQQASFEFAQFKELDDLGRLDDAWAALERGNAIMHHRLRHDAEREQRIFNAMRDQFTADFTTGASAQPEGPTPIFIIGMPRSGTTVLERLLGNHSGVTSAGELSDFSRQLQWQANHLCGPLADEFIIARNKDLDYAELGRRYLEQTQWRAHGKPFYVDKLPTNYLLAGFIHRALPHAPILHMDRDAVDTCYSNYKAMFGDAYAYSYSIPELATQYREYRRLMQHWHRIMPRRIFDVNYAELVTDPEKSAARILDYCGLAYEPGCANLAKNRATAATLSSAQVRESIHTRTLGEWRRYERQLEPLRQTLDASP